MYRNPDFTSRREAKFSFVERMLQANRERSEVNRTKWLSRNGEMRAGALLRSQRYDKRPRIRRLEPWGISLIQRNQRRRNAKDSTRRLSVCVTTGVNIEASRTAYVTVITAVTIASSAPHYPVDLVTRT